jgi:hypothetical protein
LATLVLSTIGTALGGPVGGAIGALIGQSIDQEVLSPASRGPRVGDLSVQSSSYGTQMPRLYGTMRVAGSVIWSTDLVEGEQTSGAKGQPDLTYSYSVSFAVALSSRAATAVQRIWADGKLLRDSTGAFLVSTTFRFYPGSEDQDIDPLIGSIEGLSTTPAYRGLALAVFENLELADYGNRIPFLTFEVAADAEAPTVGDILADASSGAIAADQGQQVVGYAAYGRSIAAAVQPLVDAYGIDLFEDGVHLRSPGAADAVVIGTDDLGSSADETREPTFQREQLPVRSSPGVLRLTYYDPAHDYQTGEARAVATEQPPSEVQQDLPAVLSAGDAATLAQQAIARAWAARDKLTVRLPPKQLALEPGSAIDLELVPRAWIADTVTIDGFVVVAQLRPAWVPPALPISLSRLAASSAARQDVEAVPTRVTLAMFDVPSSAGRRSGPEVVVAASDATGGWKRRTINISFAGQTISVEAPRRKSVLGFAETVLGSADACLFDHQSSVDVRLVDADQWLSSCNDERLLAGENLAVLGNEVIQFGSAVPLADGVFRLSRLLRGRAGTEWAITDHSVGDAFCMLDPATLRTVPMPSWSIGSTVSATCADAGAVSLEYRGRSAVPLSPTDLAARFNVAGDLLLTWTRRSRAGWAWIDEVDAPLGEAGEMYRVRIASGDSAVDLSSDVPNLSLSAAQLASLGTASLKIEVRQVGDFGASQPARLTIQL